MRVPWHAGGTLGSRVLFRIIAHSGTLVSGCTVRQMSRGALCSINRAWPRHSLERVKAARKPVPFIYWRSAISTKDLELIRALHLPLELLQAIKGLSADFVLVKIQRSQRRRSAPVGGLLSRGDRGAPPPPQLRPQYVVGRGQPPAYRRQ